MTVVEPSLVAIKLCYKEEIHRVRIAINTFRYDQLVDLFERTFQFASKDCFRIQYVDNESDIVHVTDDKEYTEAVQTYVAKKTDGCLRFHARDVSSSGNTFQQHIAEPLICSLEKLIAQLQTTVNALKSLDWKSKYEQSVGFSEELLQNAKEKMKVATENAKKNVNDMGLDQVVRHTGEGLKTAIDGLTMYAKDFMEEMKPGENPNELSEGKKESTVSTEASKSSESSDGSEAKGAKEAEEPNEAGKPNEEEKPNEATSMMDNDEWEKVNRGSSTIPASRERDTIPTVTANNETEKVKAVEDKTEDSVPQQGTQETQQTQQNQDNANSTAINDNETEETDKQSVRLICEVFPACKKDAAWRLLAEANYNVEVVLNRLAENGY